MTETIVVKSWSELKFEFWIHVPLTNMEVAGFMTCTETNHQSVI